MNDSARQLKPPIVETSGLVESASGVWIIPDNDHTLLVPNVGIVLGERAVLVVDTGFGPENARAVMAVARRLGEGRRIFLTHTHCHPEHGFGANVVADQTTVVYNKTQWEELQEKGPTLLRMFRKQLSAIAPMLEGVAFRAPDIGYVGSLTLDLGSGVTAELREVGGAHSRGDQVVIVHASDGQRVLFTGDLIEEGFFGIYGDNESNALAWIDRLNQLEHLVPTLVVPGHGHTGGPELIPRYRSYLELARDRTSELRSQDALTEDEIADRVTTEVLDLNPDWQNRNWVGPTVSQFIWPARA